MKQLAGAVGSVALLALTVACSTSGEGPGDSDAGGAPPGASGGNAASGSGGAASGSGGSSATGGLSNGSGGGGNVPLGPPPDFGPNVKIFDPSMSKEEIQATLDDVFSQQEEAQFDTRRFAYFFKPGSYEADVNVGFYVQVLGLGASPDDVQITGGVHAEADWFDGNATQNFWRGAENFSVTPTLQGDTNVWAISQATFFRRVHVKGKLALSDNGWSSGGFIADSVIDGGVQSGSQQQFFTRNTDLGSWNGSNWNMVFVGSNQTPTPGWPQPGYTVIEKTPVVREKPYLTIDSDGHYFVIVPHLRSDSQGPSWSPAGAAPTVLSTDQFYVAHADTDTAASINAGLQRGLHLLLTPGIYELEAAIVVDRPGSVVLGLGYATLEPQAGTAALEVADVDGVTVSGLLLDAGEQNSEVLLQVGPAGSNADHAAAPTAIHDVFCRIGGAGPGSATTCLTINSDDVHTDNLWLWRADHGQGVDWYNGNISDHGLVVNGDDVTAYGLFVEHFQKNQTVWNGEGGRTYFYQTEIPYDVPNQNAWKDGNKNGYASYKVAPTVTTHEAWGLGAYCVFYNDVDLENAFETPSIDGVKMHHLFTEWLGVNNGSQMTHIINGYGNAATMSNREQMTDF